MPYDFSWTVDSKQGVTTVALSGEFTENSDFSRLLPEIPPDVVLDLSGVRRINSCGVRGWLSFVKALNESGKRFTLERCSVPVVLQLNMISVFRGGAHIHSVFAPYYCANCQQEFQRLITADESALEQLQSPYPCPQCGSPLEFDDLPEHFLAFLQHRPGPHSPGPGSNGSASVLRMS